MELMTFCLDKIKLVTLRSLYSTIAVIKYIRLILSLGDLKSNTFYNFVTFAKNLRSFISTS